MQKVHIWYVNPAFEKARTHPYIPRTNAAVAEDIFGDKAMALFSNILDRRSRNRSVSDLGSMTDRQLEDLGLCRADIRASKSTKTVWPNRPNEAWPSA